VQPAAHGASKATSSQAVGAEPEPGQVMDRNKQRT